MAHTIFRKSVPYNTIRLGGDVAQFSIYEYTSADNPYYSGSTFLNDIRMADIQRASSAVIEPADGRVSIGPLGPMRYAIASSSLDLDDGSGVWSYQVTGSIDGFVEDREFDLASAPKDIRLGRLASWDYTAVIPGAEIDLMNIKSGGSSIWLNTTRYGCELFTDYPFWITGAKQNGNNSTRRPILIQSNIYGDKFSNYPENNFVEGTHASDMNDILSVVPLISKYGEDLGAEVSSFATIGRRTSSSGNGKVQAYIVAISSNGNISLSTTGTALNMSTAVSSNYASSGACYISDGLFAVVGGKGNGSFGLNRVTWGGSSFSSTSTTLDSSNGFGATRGDVVSFKSDYGASNKYVAAVWTETKSSFNRYCRIQMFNLNSSISTVGSEGTVFDVSNSLKMARATVLASNDDEAWVLVGVSDSTGNVRLKIMRWNAGGSTWTDLDSQTYAFGDTSLQDLFSLTTLSAIQKASISISGNKFVPGGTNDFEDRVYWSMIVSTNSETDSVDLVYGYYDINNNKLRILNTGGETIMQGRNACVMKNHYGTDGRTWADGLPVRNEAGPVFMPIIGGRYVNSSTKHLTLSCLGLDYKPNWNSTGGDPGGDIFDTIGNEYTTNTNFTTPGDAGDWGVESRWKVGFPFNKGSFNYIPPPYTAGVSNQYLVSLSPSIGFSNAAVGTGLYYLTLNDRDADGNNWGDFFTNTLIPYQTSNPVYLTLRTDNGNLSASFTISTSNTLLRPNIPGAGASPYLSILWFNASNSHSGDSWAFLNSGENGINEAYVTARFTQTP